ncbi:MAG TPA: hypothetical protein PKC59_06505 [Burkholderiaceae bacterium]|nr:hypothetical protein [Burkholderiaceae bacterium]HMX09771.1 hypothetical protein [Burkholderiaceae bacterium]HMY99216.1 hypothetical protein [Burkholderiaceae bacterium]HNB43034.1 hypothetical protein [Burkholderiaceae bacterium]HNG79026.1 hypothetical protein [Burkholderiaceae bacterium]
MTDTAGPPNGHGAKAEPIASWYLIDAQDRIVDLCPEWDQVALLGGARSGSLRDGVIGRPLSRFIADDMTRMYMEALLQSCRLSHRPRNLPYRCDTPDLLREMEMHLQPLPNDQVRVEHRLLKSSPRSSRYAAQPMTFGSDRRLWRCSMCLRLGERTPQGRWSEASAAIDPKVQVLYTLCPSCRQTR